MILTFLWCQIQPLMKTWLASVAEGSQLVASWRQMICLALSRTKMSSFQEEKKQGRLTISLTNSLINKHPRWTSVVTTSNQETKRNRVVLGRTISVQELRVEVLLFPRCRPHPSFRAKRWLQLTFSLRLMQSKTLSLNSRIMSLQAVIWPWLRTYMQRLSRSTKRSRTLITTRSPLSKVCIKT